MRNVVASVLQLVRGEMTARDTRSTSLAIVVHLSVATTFFGVACAGLVTSSHLGGEIGGVFRSFVVPGASVAIVSTIVSTRSLVTVHDRAARARWRSWARAGVPRRAASVVVSSHLTALAVGAAAAGLSLTTLLVRAFGTVAVPTDPGPARVVVRLDAVGAGSALLLTAASVVPAFLPSIRQPYGRRAPLVPRRWVGPVRVAASAGPALVIALFAANGDFSRPEDVERSVALSLLLVVVLVLTLSAAIVRGASTVVHALAERLPRATPTTLVLAVTGASDGLRRAPGAPTPVAAVSALLGGVPAVFLAGEAALRRIGPGEAPVDVLALLLTLGPALLLGATASTITYSVARPGRLRDFRTLRSCGATSARTAIVAVAEAVLFALPALATSTAISALAVLPVALAAGLTPLDLVLAVANPLLVLGQSLLTLGLAVAAILAWAVAETGGRVRRSVTPRVAR